MGSFGGSSLIITLTVKKEEELLQIRMMRNQCVILSLNTVWSMTRDAAYKLRLEKYRNTDNHHNRQNKVKLSS